MSCLMLKKGVTLTHKDHRQELKWLWLSFTEPCHRAHGNPNTDVSIAPIIHIILQLRVSESSGSTLTAADTLRFAALSLLHHLEVPSGIFPLLGLQADSLVSSPKLLVVHFTATHRSLL